MKIKIIGILVCMLLIAITLIGVTAQNNQLIIISAHVDLENNYLWIYGSNFGGDPQVILNCSSTIVISSSDTLIAVELPEINPGTYRLEVSDGEYIVPTPNKWDSIDIGIKDCEGLEGPPGPAPAHQWLGTSLQFQNPDGTWGIPVDLIGPEGPPGESDFPESPFDGSVLLTNDQQKTINNWIGNPFQTWHIAYRRSTHGATSTAFHNNCDYKGPTVTIISLDNGKLLGGYTIASWTYYSSGYKATYDSFLFSLNEMKMYPIHNPDYAIYSNIGNGPTFGDGHDLKINSDMTTGYCNFPHSYCWQGQITPDTTAQNELCGGYSSWSITEIEVFIKDGISE